MLRLFVGIQLPQMVRDRLLQMQCSMEGIRWQRDDQLHLTLRFIGEVNGHQADAIADALATISFQPFDVQLEGLGLFGKPKQPRLLYADVRHGDPLHHLHKKIDQALVRIGIPPETRKFKPHVTLARFKGKPGPRFQEFMMARQATFIPSFTVNEFVLFESHLCQDGALYDPVESYPAFLDGMFVQDPLYGGQVAIPERL